MSRKDVNDISVKLAGIDAKLDSVVDLIRRHDEMLAGHATRLHHAEKHINTALGYAGAIGLVFSIIGTWVAEKLGLK